MYSNHIVIQQMFRITRRGFNTLKSKNDERANESLLNRLRSLPKLGENKLVEPKPRIEHKNQHRQLTLERLSRLLCLNLSDPIVWNSSILSRIFKIPEEYGDYLIIYTKPLTYYSDNKVNEIIQKLKNPFVVDVARLKYDKTYELSYKKIVFADTGSRQTLKTSESDASIIRTDENN